MTPTESFRFAYKLHGSTKSIRLFGLAAELAREAIAIEKMAKDRQFAAEAATEARIRQLECDIEVLDTTAKLLQSASLIVANYRQHSRGAWRRRRKDSAPSRGG